MPTWRLATEVIHAQGATSGEVVAAITTDATVVLNPACAARALFNYLLIQKKRYDQREARQ